MTTAQLLDHVAMRPLGMLGQELADALDKYCPQYEITTPLRLAHFLGQACHETGCFRYFKEIWGPTSYQKAYEGRADLGNVRVGDGYLFRGRGIFQLTGRDNYTRTGAALGLPLVDDPDVAAEPDPAVHIACHYWQTHGISAAADANDIIRVTRPINPGLLGLQDRRDCFARAREVLP